MHLLPWAEQNQEEACQVNCECGCDAVQHGGEMSGSTLPELSNSPAERLHVGMKVRHDLHLSLCFVLAKFSRIGLPLACKLGTDKGSRVPCFCARLC